MRTQTANLLAVEKTDARKSAENVGTYREDWHLIIVI